MDITSHFSVTLEPKPTSIWTAKLVQKEALKYSTRSDFQQGTPGAYVYAQRNKLLTKVCSHMPKCARFLWTKKAAQAEAIKYTTRVAFLTHSRGAYNYARRNDILNELCAHMPARVYKTRGTTND